MKKIKYRVLWRFDGFVGGDRRREIQMMFKSICSLTGEKISCDMTNHVSFVIEIDMCLKQKLLSSIVLGRVRLPRDHALLENISDQQIITLTYPISKVEMDDPLIEEKLKQDIVRLLSDALVETVVLEKVG